MIDQNTRVALPFRAAGFLLFQLLIALFVDWDQSSAWWPIAALMTSIATIWLLVFLTQREGRSYWSIFHFNRDTVRIDLTWLLALLAVTMPMAFVPNIGVASLLFGDPQVALDMLVRPLPMWAVVLAFGFPLTIMFAELPLYFGYIMPKLEEAGRPGWVATMVPALFLSAQHVTLLLIFDWRFALWRLVMFLPFALLVGYAGGRRPSLLPYLVVVHAIIDMGMVATLLPLVS